METHGGFLSALEPIQSQGSLSMPLGVGRAEMVPLMPTADTRAGQRQERKGPREKRRKPGPQGREGGTGNRQEGAWPLALCSVLEPWT